ncbi:MAG: NADPH-dependent assimilatory sulfite reductase hemoprotein subunit [bacterium]|nr:NADPH-dependent assimilatory sulfite reductase hemoprotein subunit [bacterium]
MSADGQDQPESKMERVKKASRALRGTIEQALASDTAKFDPDDAQLLKFHGTYQGYDRDARRAGGQGRAERRHQFMIRCKIPGGVLTPGQYLALDALTDELADGTTRITSRQGLQYHGVLKSDLRRAIAGINRTLITTLGACGDVSRNVMICPAPAADPVHAEIAALGQRIAEELTPATRAYHELWLDGEKVDSANEEEPFYGPQYLPRKFKVALAMPGDNCVDLYTNDVGLLPVVADGRIVGVNALVGGGLGMTHGKAHTFARLASPLGCVAPEAVVATARTIAAVYRDWGNRSDRRQARLKYLLEKRGHSTFRDEVVRRLDHELRPWIEPAPLHAHDHLGRHHVGDDNWYYGLYVENGRLRDQAQRRLRTAVRAIVDQLSPGIRLTPQQNMLFTDLSASAVDRLGRILDEHDVPRSERVTPLRRLSLACPALPTCGLAISEAERVMPPILDEFDRELAALGLADEPINVRLTGCPNGCARPYSAEIGIVGRSADAYDVYVGGRGAGDRMTDLYTEQVPRAGLLAAVRPLLVEWRDTREPGESFGDFYQRTHHVGPPRQILTGAKLEGTES